MFSKSHSATHAPRNENAKGAAPAPCCSLRGARQPDALSSQPRERARHASRPTPLPHSIDCFFRTTISPRGRTFVGRRLRFRHAGNAPRYAVRSAKLGKNTRCILREAFYVNTSAAVKRARSSQPTLATPALATGRYSLRVPSAASSALVSGFMKKDRTASTQLAPRVAQAQRRRRVRLRRHACASAACTSLREQLRTADRPATRS